MSIAHLSAKLSKITWDIYDGNANSFHRLSRRELALDRAALGALVLERLKAILSFAFENSAHYREAFEAHGVHPSRLKSLDDIALFPELTRSHLLNGLEKVTVGGAERSGWVKSATGGTTSSPISYYRDKTCTLKRLSDTACIDGWYGRVLGDRVAYLWGAPQDFAQAPSLGMRLRNLSYQRTIMLPSAPLNDNVMVSHLERLDAWRPSFLQAYPTPLYEFCKFLADKGRRLPYLAGVSVTAEALYRHQRELIEEVLGLKVFNWYGSRELGRVASECECHEGLHLNEPSVHVEVVPDPALPEGCGHLVITDLWNRATPFIRYRTGDIARTLTGPCSCGRALRRIAGIEGRLVDTIVLPGGRKVPGVSLTNRVIKECAEVAELQVVQKSLDLFVLRYVKGPQFHAGTLDALAANLRGLLAAEVPIRFEEVSELPRAKSGKVRFVISEISDEQQTVAL